MSFPRKVFDLENTREIKRVMLSTHITSFTGYINRFLSADFTFERNELLSIQFVYVPININLHKSIYTCL